MRDEDYRKEAKDSSKRAATSGITIARSSIEYIRALEYYYQIKNITVEDIRAMAEIHRSLGSNDYKRKSYIDAANNYSNGINQLNEKLDERDDPDYRLLTWLYIGLADTFFELDKTEEGSTAFNDAQKTFNRINIKTAEDYRKFDRACKKIAAKSNIKLVVSSKIYIIALENYDQIGDKTPGDIRAMVEIYRSLGTNYFNQGNHKNAADTYSNGINLLRAVYSEELYVLTDEDYRLLTWLYIDLSDAFLELHNAEAGFSAFNNAQEAFKRVKNKSAEEILIGNDVNKFREYFEKILASEGYRTSSTYRNHQLILINKKEDNAFSEEFDSINLARITNHDPIVTAISPEEIEEHDKSLNILITQLEGIYVKKPEFFPSVPQDNCDQNYRDTATNFLRLTQQLSHRGLIEDICSAYEEAKNALNKIESKESSDFECLEIIKQNLVNWKKIAATQAGASHTINSTQPTPPASIVPHLAQTLFAPPSSPTTPDPLSPLAGEFAMDTDDEVIWDADLGEDGEWDKFIGEGSPAL